MPRSISDDVEFVELSLTPPLHQHRRLHYGNPARVFLPPASHRRVLLRDDERVQNRIQELALPLVAEHDRAETRAVERAVRAQDLRAERFDDRTEALRPRLDHTPRRVVRVKDVTTKPRQHARHETHPYRNRT